MTNLNAEFAIDKITLMDASKEHNISNALNIPTESNKSVGLWAMDFGQDISLLFVLKNNKSYYYNFLDKKLYENNDTLDSSFSTHINTDNKEFNIDTRASNWQEQPSGQTVFQKNAITSSFTMLQKDNNYTLTWDSVLINGESVDIAIVDGSVNSLEDLPNGLVDILGENIANNAKFTFSTNDLKEGNTYKIFVGGSGLNWSLSNEFTIGDELKFSLSILNYQISPYAITNIQYIGLDGDRENFPIASSNKLESKPQNDIQVLVMEKGEKFSLRFDTNNGHICIILQIKNYTNKKMPLQIRFKQILLKI